MRMRVPLRMRMRMRMRMRLLLRMQMPLQMPLLTLMPGRSSWSAPHRTDILNGGRRPPASQATRARSHDRIELGSGELLALEILMP